MNSNQRSEGNNQSNNGGNELGMNSARAGTADRNNIDPATQRDGQTGSQQSGAASGNQQAGNQQSGNQQSGNQQSGGMQSGSQQSGGQQSGQPGTDRGQQGRGTYEETGSQPSGAHQPGYQNADAGNQQSTDRQGSETGSQQSRTERSVDQVAQGNMQGDNSDGRITNDAGRGERQSNDVAGGMPKSPGGNRQSADQKMDDDTGLSNTANREPSELDQNLRQERQSNVGRRSDGTPD